VSLEGECLKRLALDGGEINEQAAAAADA
jgi:hypothetical protein